MQNELLKSLNKLAEKRSTPFCYSCYQKCPEGKCPTCGSDDLMKILTADSFASCDRRHTVHPVHNGTEWIVKDILATELKEVDTEEAFEEYVRACYEETIQVGWLNLDVASVLKDQDPISWDMVKSEYLDNEVSDDILVTFDNGSTYYQMSDVEELIEGED